MWYQGLLFKLKSYGVERNVLRLYPDNRKQRVLLDSQCSSSKIIFSGVPKGSVLGPLLFLIYMNDLLNVLDSIYKTFADDTWYVFLSKAFDKDKPKGDLNNDLSIIIEWALQWKMQFNPDPNKEAKEVYVTLDVTLYSY